MANRSVISLFLVLLGINGSISISKQDLGGSWLLKDASGKYENVPSKVPGGVYSDLMNENHIGNIYYGYNDTETRWVSKSNWTYHRDFSINKETLSYSNIVLVFEGLDTFASIRLNGVEVGKSQNMFVRYLFPVKSILKEGSNTIEVEFTSPILMSETLVAKTNYSVPPTCPPREYRGECNANQIRKMQSSFSWDWGPAFPSMGIWKPVFLEASNCSMIRDVVVSTEEGKDDTWRITVKTYLEVHKNGNRNERILHKLDTDNGVITQIVNYDQSSNNKEINFTFSIPRSFVRRWWPNGYGAQVLYNFTTMFVSVPEVDSKSLRIGFRTIDLIQEPVTQNSTDGLSFYFKVNNVPIFAKGSNQIPLDLLPERGQDPKIIHNILSSARDVNMNMLRVWGGGVYESDYFYDLADEFGILIWQDLMFACAMYPSYPEFLNNVKNEVQQQLKRLSSHASLALWAGNNENEVALVGNWYGTISNYNLYKRDYLALYIDTIQKETDKFGVIYIASSPSNGLKSIEEGYLSEHPQDPHFGDVHYYNYLLNSLDESTYPIPRFASEFGYQSLPDVETWKTVTDNVTDLLPDSDFIDHRQHHPLGFMQNTMLINYQLHLDFQSVNLAETYIYYSQIVQALSIKYEVELYRSFMGRLDERGQGNTMGALYWQLNDVWVAPTWSGIDHTGKWKMLHYFAQDFFAANLITGRLNIERELILYALIETPSLSSPLDALVLVEVYNWNSFDPVNSTEIEISLEFGVALKLAPINTDDFLKDVGCGSLSEARNQCFFHLTLKSHSNVVISANNIVLATTLKNSNLQAVTVKVNGTKQIDNDGKKFEITINSTGIAMFVWLDSHGIKGRFSENGWNQVKPTKVVYFQSEQKTTAEELKILSVTHLKDSIH